MEKVIVDLQSGLMVPLLPTWELLGVNNNTQKPPSPSLFLQQQQLQQLIKGENSARAPGTPSLLDCTLEYLSERWREKDRERIRGLREMDGSLGVFETDGIRTIGNNGNKHRRT